MSASFGCFPPQGGSSGPLTTGDLAEVLGIGNTTGGTDLDVSTGDTIAGVAELALVSDSGAITLTATGGSLDLTSGDGSNLTLQTADSTTTHSGGIITTTGDTSSGNSGSYVCDVGTASGTAGTMTFGGTNTSAVNVGRASLGLLDINSADVTLTGSTGSGNGGPVEIYGGDNTGTANGGGIEIAGGAASGGGKTGGDVSVNAGSGSAGATDGAVNVGVTIASAVNIGRSGVTTTFPGTTNATITDGVISSTGLGAATAIKLGAGSVTTPAITFGETDTGIYGAAGLVGLVMDGAAALYIQSSQIVATKIVTSQGGMVVADDKRIAYGTGTDVFQQGELTSLTDGSATTVFSVVMANGDMAGIKIDYTIQMTDATEYQSECGTVHIAIVDDAGGVVASTPGVTAVQALSSGTLGVAWTVVTTDDQSVEIQCNANSSLTTSTSQIRWLATCSGDVTLVVP